ncbi:MAG: histidinol-phosphatase HisJ family protein [Clostridia bacterium]|nr:histidinol-phosphatase HisJ family protein [Clostridia bacterium]
MFDSHTHTTFSTDSKMSPDDACMKAVELGLEGIAFTDHLDLDYPGYDNFVVNFDDYSKTIDEIKNKFKNKLHVIKGIEVGLQPCTNNENLKIVAAYDFDFVIASVHVIDGMDPYLREYYKGKSKMQSDLRYLDAVLDATAYFKNYDVIGHIGYVRRYGSYDDNTLRYVDYPDIIDSILKNVISDGKGIEINTSGLRSNLGTPIPDFDIIKRFKELGGEIITVGSDAHYIEHLGHSFSYVKEALQEAGFKYLAHYENRKAIFDKI